MEKKELRFNPVAMSIRCDEAGLPTRCISGTAIVFNSQSELISEQGLRFYEVIKPSAVNQELINKSDIAMLYNHSKDEGILARSKKGAGTLNINITATGVDFEFDAPCSSLGNMVLESVKRGDLDACSFAFYVAAGGDVWQKMGDIYQRTINLISSLADFSIVFSPAYTATSCNSRGLTELIEIETAEAEAQRALEAEAIETQRLLEAEQVEAQRLLDVEASERALADYYSNLKEIIKAIV